MPDNPESPGRDSWSRAEIDAAIAGLDRATRAFSRQVDAMGVTSPDRAEPAERVPTPGEDAARVSPEVEESAPAPVARIDPETAFEAQMRQAQDEAEEYLERAKGRADSLVNTMIGAVEREATEIREEAERGIRERWRAVEAEAGRFLGDAKRVADSMVAERQDRISELSDGIAARAQALTRGMEDADRVQRQFEGFVRTLSETADQIARQSTGSVESEITRLQRRRPDRPRAAAAA